ncbi:hypothetical protein EX895_005567, partial [Sporisorium graminicola]
AEPRLHARHSLRGVAVGSSGAGSVAHHMLPPLSRYSQAGVPRGVWHDVYQPAIADPQVDELLAQRALQLVAAFALSGRATLAVYFLPPSSKSSSSIKADAATTTSLTEPSSNSTSTSSKQGVVHTAAHAASSLRAWASPRNYPYGWLAQAFSSGAGQPSGTFVPPSASSPAQVQDELAHIEAEAFERWHITFELKQRGVVKKELARFVESVVGFVERNKAHLPAIPSADLCPYPMHIFVRAV